MLPAAKILVIDDEALNLEILSDCLRRDGFEVICAEDGLIALQILDQTANVDVILLDRMMPRMNGIEFLNRIKGDKRFRDIPVVMQTAAASTQQVLEGIDAGVFHYLSKPYEDTMLLSIVHSALRDARNTKEMKQEVVTQRHALGLMESATFRLRTLDEAKNLAYYLANCFPDPTTAVLGLTELLVNGIEHGNLGISYSEKSKLVMSGEWQQEIERRLRLPENKEKFLRVSYSANAHDISVTITDQGLGFDWEQYLYFSPERAGDPNGRGIATSRLMSFSRLEYRGGGNEVVCSVDLRQSPEGTGG